MKAKTVKQVKHKKEKRKARPLKIPVIRNNVFFVGLNKLDKEDQESIKNIIFKEYITLERELKRINSIKVHFKEYKKLGKGKYSIQMLIDAHTHPIVVDHMYTPVQWDPVAEMYKVIEKAKKQIIHKFKTDTSWRKSYQKGIL